MFLSPLQTKKITKQFNLYEDGLISKEEAYDEVHRIKNGDMKRLFIEEKTSYGRTLFYPACERAKEYAQELGKKTFSKSNLHFIESLGIAVACKTNDYWQSRY